MPVAITHAAAGLYDQRLDETEIMLLYQAVQAANATKTLLALGNSETLPQAAPPPSSPQVAPGAPVVCLVPSYNTTSEESQLQE